MTTSQGNTLERTEVLYGLDNIMNKSIQFLSKAHKIDLCGDNRSASAILDIAEYKKYYLKLKIEVLKQDMLQKLTKTI